MSSGVEAPIGAWQLIKHNPRFRRLWTAQLISSAGDWFNSVAVLGLVSALTKGSGLAISLVLLCSTLPSFFLIPIAGPIVDRFDRRNLMILVNVLAAGASLLFLLVHDTGTVWIAYLASVALISLASFFVPASSASIPNIVSNAELFPANALSGSTWGVMAMVGSALGGIVSATFGSNAAFVINSISFILAAVLIATVTIPSPKSERALTPLKDFAEGVRYLRGNLPSLSLVAVKLGWGLGGGVLVLLTIFGEQIFKAGDAGIGILYSARGLGALLGPLVVRRLFGYRVDNLRNALWFSFLLIGVGYAVFAWAGWQGSLWLGALALVIAHFGGGTVWVISSVLLQLSTPDRLRGRVLSVDNGLNTLTTGLSTLAFGVALQVGVVPMVMALVGGILFSVYGVIWGLVTAQGPLLVSDSTVVIAPVSDTA